ncbi:MAG: zinc-ribbon domain-containing protein, partial [Thermodesulfobacteriota bacterium]|nr:zinc-ribbon domain-containing protein [Thermodesulfobacteriota bacterium]
MIVTCENCEAKFDLDENLIKESGSKVRCSKCQHIFTAYKPVPTPEIPPEPGLEEEASGPSEEGVEASLFSEEDLRPEVSEEADASLDLDLFEDEGATDEEAFSLDDLTLDDDFLPEELDEAAGQVADEEESLVQEEVGEGDLGFEEELGVEGFSEPTTEEQGEEEMALEDLGLDEEIPFQDALPLSEEGGEE